MICGDFMTKDEWYKQLFERLGNSKFRSSFHLKQKDIDYINEKGLDTIRQHAIDFIAKREAPAVIPNDGTGVYSFPVELAAKIAVKTVSRFLEDNKNSFDLVEWVLFDSVTESVYEKEVDKLYS